MLVLILGGRYEVDLDPIYGCWRWLGDTDNEGYPWVKDGRRRVRAHTFVWEKRYGAVPANRELDHLCRRRWCVRHLEPVTRNENELRKSWARRVKRERCAAGHPLFENGIRTPEGGIVCRKCNRGEP